MAKGFYGKASVFKNKVTGTIAERGTLDDTPLLGCIAIGHNAKDYALFHGNRNPTVGKCGGMDNRFWEQSIDLRNSGICLGSVLCGQRFKRKVKGVLQWGRAILGSSGLH